MSYEIEKFRNDDPLRRNESQFRVISDQDVTEDGKFVRNVLTVHPWARTHRDGNVDRSVFVSVGWEEYDAEEGFWATNDGEDGSPGVWNIIVDRDDFLDALLAVFPDEILDLRS